MLPIESKNLKNSIKVWIIKWRNTVWIIPQASRKSQIGQSSFLNRIYAFIVEKKTIISIHLLTAEDVTDGIIKTVAINALIVIPDIHYYTK